MGFGIAEPADLEETDVVQHIDSLLRDRAELSIYSEYSNRSDRLFDENRGADRRGCFSVGVRGTGALQEELALAGRGRHHGVDRPGAALHGGVCRTICIPAAPA